VSREADRHTGSTHGDAAGASEARADMAAWRAAGLYDPAATDAADRLAVLEFLRDHGATLHEIVEAATLGRLPGLAAELARRQGVERITPRDLATEGIISVDLFTKVWRALGLADVDPDDPVLTERDRKGFAGAAAAVEFFGEDATLQFSRAMGAALATIADAAMAVFGINVSARLRAEGGSEFEETRAAWEAGSMMIESTLPAIEAVFLHHVEAAGRRFSISGRGDTATMAVGFLDLVNSTALVLHLDAAELGRAFGAFEQRATEVIASHRGRLVKTIGDEVMFVTPDARDACVVALELVDFAREHPAFDGLRGALAAGPMIRGYGDFYGPVVNLAARAVKLVGPGEIVGDAAVAAALTGDTDIAVTPAGEYPLRGFDAPVALYRVRWR
jgi:adenylate cyclase